VCTYCVYDVYTLCVCVSCVHKVCVYVCVYTVCVRVSTVNVQKKGDFFFGFGGIVARCLSVYVTRLCVCVCVCVIRLCVQFKRRRRLGEVDDPDIRVCTFCSNTRVEAEQYRSVLLSQQLVDWKPEKSAAQLKFNSRHSNCKVSRIIAASDASKVASLVKEQNALDVKVRRYSAHRIIHSGLLCLSVCVCVCVCV